MHLPAHSTYYTDLTLRLILKMYTPGAILAATHTHTTYFHIDSTHSLPLAPPTRRIPALTRKAYILPLIPLPITPFPLVHQHLPIHLIVHEVLCESDRKLRSVCVLFEEVLERLFACLNVFAFVLTGAPEIQVKEGNEGGEGEKKRVDRRREREGRVKDGEGRRKEGRERGGGGRERRAGRRKG